MGKAKNATTLGVHTRNEIINEIVRRGEALGVKKGTYAAQVLEWWWAQGCPPISEPDKLMQTAKGKSSTKRAG